MDAAGWDTRYSEAQQWSDEPNAHAAQLLAGLPPGRALDLAAGEGRMALWLASSGWQVTALDFSAVGLARGRARAAERGLDVDWRVADATTVELESASYDLVLVLYLHLTRPELTAALSRAAAALAPGGLLLALGHDRDNLDRGAGGPQDPALLWDVDVLREVAAGLRIEQLGQVERPVGDAVAVDVLLTARRPELLGGRGSQ